MEKRHRPLAPSRPVGATNAAIGAMAPRQQAAPASGRRPARVRLNTFRARDPNAKGQAPGACIVSDICALLPEKKRDAKVFATER